MPKRVITYSGISDVQLEDNEIAVTVKGAGTRFERSIDELKKLKPLDNVHELDVVYPGGQRETILVSKTEFRKYVSDEKLASFPSNRGRQPGYSPNSPRPTALRQTIELLKIIVWWRL
jgi:hypothetical protein